MCYLQGLLADRIPGYSRTRLFYDMDAWGYSFRLGSARPGSNRMPADARRWLIDHRIIDDAQHPTGLLRR